MSKKSMYLISVLVLSVVLTGMTKAELVGWWRLDEGSGTTAYDSSSNGNDARFEGSPAWVEDGKFGKALKAVWVFYISIANLYLFFEPGPSFAVPKGMPCGKDGTG